MQGNSTWPSQIKKDEAERRYKWFSKKYSDQEKSMDLTFSAPPDEEKSWYIIILRKLSSLKEGLIENQSYQFFQIIKLKTFH